MKQLLTFGLFGLILLASSVQGQVPNTISYQGILDSSDGEHVPDGNYDLTFTLWDDSTCGTQLWQEDHNNVPVQDGRFHIILGSLTSLASVPFDEPYWLGITVEPPSTELPRIELTSSAYSLNARSVMDNAVTSSKIQDGTIVNGDISNSANISPSKISGTSWTSTNDGSGSGLDADLLDGQHASAFLSTANDYGRSGVAVNLYEGTSTLTSKYVNEGQVNSVTSPMITDGSIVNGDISNLAGISPSKILGTAWTSSNDGPGSGLNADLLDGQHASAFLSTANDYGRSGVAENLYEGTSTPQTLTSKYVNASGDVMTGLLSFDNPGGPTNISFKYNGETRGWVKADPSIARVEFHANGYYYFTSDVTDAIEGRTNANSCSGVIGTSDASGAAGVSGHNHRADGNAYGVAGWSNAGKAIYGYSETGWAGYFDGDVYIAGTLVGGKSSIKIDHPLDPENKYLYHSFVESPDMKNVYDGVVELNANGRTTVVLPDYFEALNKDFRYQLTCIGGYAPVYIAQEVRGNQFEIAGGQPGMRVSWQVTGIRKDAFAEANRVQVEVDKAANERGRYLHPGAYGFGEEHGINFEIREPHLKRFGSR